jgi:hypothetical protein
MSICRRVVNESVYSGCEDFSIPVGKRDWNRYFRRISGKEFHSFMSLWNQFPHATDSSACVEQWLLVRMESIRPEDSLGELGGWLGLSHPVPPNACGSILVGDGCCDNDQPIGISAGLLGSDGS